MSSSHAARPSGLERVADLSEAAFVSKYLVGNRPVIITGAMRGWKALETWRPEALRRRFGNERVQVYGDLFRLAAISSLGEYLERYFDQPTKKSASVPYLRWYCHLTNDERVPWADEIFNKISDEWERPAFFPSHSFVLPYCAQSDSIDPTRNWFPARGLFISARGARTRLHADPWASDAVLCQVYGRKEFVMYDPSQARHLTANGKTVDIEAPDVALFPSYSEARPAFQDTLEPGEIVLVPAGWLHHFNSVSDSVSVTWNFVHSSRLQEFLRYLVRGPGETELKQLGYAYSGSR
ncbi:MAG: cupin-like domain-containing protein [Acidobacteria bacterium]|nr:cupin-like domain-containing protein [Acidobacteriota bacterium]